MEQGGAGTLAVHAPALNGRRASCTYTIRSRAQCSLLAHAQAQGLTCYDLTAVQHVRSTSAHR
eukprot:16231-Heterococcus_DN1.PRE.1